MKKLLSALLALMLLLGCAAFAEGFDYIGEWVLTGVEMSGMSMEPSQLGLTMTMELRADGTCTLTNMGTPEEGVWAEVDGGVAVTDAAGDVNTFAPVEGKLEATQQGMKIIFSRVGDAASYVGVWVLTGMESQGVQMGVSTMEMFGLTMTMTLNEDGTCVVASSGIEESGTWQATALGVAITDPTETLEFSYVDEMLVIEEQGSTLMLTREGAAPAVAESVAAAVLTNVAPEAFEGKWQLVSANLLGMDYTAEQLGVSIAFELAAGQGTYIEGDSTGAVYELPVTYTVTEAEGVGTVMDLLYQDETMTEAVVLLSLNMVDDGRLLCVLDVEGMEVRYCFNAVVEEAAAE